MSGLDDTAPSISRLDSPQRLTTVHRIATSSDLVYQPAEPVYTRTMLLRQEAPGSLNLAEIRVYDEAGIDMAPTSTIYQPTYWPAYPPFNIVDGNVATFTHTFVSPLLLSRSDRLVVC